MSAGTHALVLARYENRGRVLLAAGYQKYQKMSFEDRGIDDYPQQPQTPSNYVYGVERIP